MNCIKKVIIYLQVLYYYILVGYEAVNPVVSALPPVFRCTMIQQKGCTFFEGQLSRSPTHVVKLCNGFNLLQLCKCMRERGTVQLGLISMFAQRIMSTNFQRASKHCNRLKSVILPAGSQQNTHTHTNTMSKHVSNLTIQT